MPSISPIRAAFRENDFDIKIIKPQFFLPMFAHRVLNGWRMLQVAEIGFRRLGITQLFGSPVLLRADRNTAVPAHQVADR